MKYWITSERGTGSEYIDGSDGSQLRITPAYIEYVSPPHPLHIVTYFIVLSQIDYFVAHCWGNEFDAPVHLMSYPTTSAGAIKSARQAWPTFVELLSNSTQDKPRLRDGVIIRVNDFDDGNPIWLIGSYLGNIQMFDNDGLLTAQLFSDRSLAVVNKVYKLSASVFSEFDTTSLINLPDLLLNIGSEAEKASLMRFGKVIGQIVDKTLTMGLGEVIYKYIRDESRI